ncbi:MAG: hypothetical protein RB191_09460, partial [Terriglobia bacterium]|nr:hypothetical protein [Terriglobia bacterium]
KHSLGRTLKAKPTASVDGKANIDATPSMTNRCNGWRSDGGESLMPIAQILASSGRSSKIENCIAIIAASRLIPITGNTNSHFKAILSLGFIPPKYSCSV